MQDDFKSKVTEVATLRADNEKFKVISKEAEDKLKAAEDRVRDFERQMKNLKIEKNSVQKYFALNFVYNFDLQFAGSKEQLVEQEQQLIVAKQRFREAQDELEELRAFIQDQQGQMDDYRNKVPNSNILNQKITIFFSIWKLSNKLRSKNAK